MMQSNFIRLLLVFIVVVFFNIIAANWAFRLDLTSDKRYSVSKVSKNYLDQIDNTVYVKVYLSGDLPAGFQKLKSATQDLLDEFRFRADQKIRYEFINLYEDVPDDLRENVLKELYDKGIQPTNIQIEEDGGTSQKLIFPGAIVSYNNIELGVNLLSNNPGLSAEMNLNNSIQQLEYKFINVLKSLVSRGDNNIAFIEGHGELNWLETREIELDLANYFNVFRSPLIGYVDSLKKYNCNIWIVAKPRSPFTEEEKFALDQHIMSGGKILWFIDPVEPNEDSLMLMGRTFAFGRDLNLDDLFFKYGIRMNYQLIKDLQSNVLPFKVMIAGNQSKMVPKQWFYHPLVSGYDGHLISKNLNLIKTSYASSIDTLSIPNVKHQVLLASSEYAKRSIVPSLIELREVDQKPVSSEYQSEHIPIAVLSEGVFKSAFKNRAGYKNVIEESVPTKMLFVADGDIIRNDVQYGQKPKTYKLGVDRFSKQTFGNTEFIMNVINYLSDDDGLIELRGREFKLRLLDKQKVKQERVKWQLVNTLLPLSFVVILGIIIQWQRRRRHS